MTNAGALRGLKVIEFDRHFAGPMLGMLLADQGAEVIKVEPPSGDALRSQTEFGIWHRGKRSLVLDLTTPSGRSDALQLLKGADVVIEDLGSGAAERYGIAYSEVSGLNPSVVYCSLPSGRRGRFRDDVPGTDALVSAETTLYQPEASKTPVYTPIPVASATAAALAADALIAALIARQRFGIGQYVEVPLSRAVLNVMARRVVEVNGSRELDGSQHPRLPIAGDYLCSDGRWFHSHGSFDHFVDALLKVAGRPELIPEGRSLVYRAPDREIVDVWRERFAEMFIQQPSWYWEAEINKERGAGCVCRTVEEWMSSDHVRQSGLVVDVDDPVVGILRQAGLVANLGLTPGGIRRGAPRLGEHSLSECLEVSGWGAPAPVTSKVSAPLAGVRVLDLCIVLAGPTCGRMLADFGADVIKINDHNRTEEQYQALDVNRGKRSILVDLKTPGGLDVFWRLFESADVVIENFRPGKMEALGIGYDELKRRRPELVFTSMNAWGFGGEWSDRAGWEGVAQAFSGLTVRAGGRDGKPSGARYPINDYTCGLLGAQGTLLALLERFRTGRGQAVNTGLACAAGFLQSNLMYDYRGYVRHEPEGPGLLGSSPFAHFYQTSDGRYIFVDASDDAVRLLGLPEFRHLGASTTEISADALSRVFATKSEAEWIETLERAGVGVARNVSYQEFKADRSRWESGALVTREHPGFGEVTHVGVLALMSRTPPALGRPAPAFGADAVDILSEVGFSQGEIRALEQEKAVDLIDLSQPQGQGTGELRHIGKFAISEGVRTHA